MPVDPRSPMIQRVRQSVILALKLGGLAAAVATIVYFFGNPSKLEQAGLSLPGLLAIYLAVAVVCGSLYGLLRPLVRGRVSAVVVALLCTLPVYVGIYFWAAEGRHDLVGVLLICLFWGWMSLLLGLGAYEFLGSAAADSTASAAQTKQRGKFRDRRRQGR